MNTVKNFFVSNSRTIIAIAFACAILGIHEIGVNYFGVVENGTYAYFPMMIGLILGLSFMKKK